MRSRRLDYSESTRSALVDSAVELFTKRGYAGTSLDEVAKRARVTKGALYHHFSGKQALFEAAFEQVESLVYDRLQKIMTGDGEPWERAMSGLQAFIRSCLDPSYQRIAIHEGPVVMGWERWREAEEQSSFGLVRSGLQLLVDAGEVEPVPVDLTARLLFGALSSAATEIAGAADPKKVGAEIEDVITRMLTRLRRPAEEQERPAAG
ncbi:TetR/AcrR family transcriptional regulator [Amycolatopsis echigonensis]|uniref:TetR family transcriptional regulator n=1 Tax=Amycolatopsis echigonensis TaxID=2576905 RepID=A0A2N3WAH4_9PSEU|nr:MULTISPECIES: TetR/AcrR family transcriptional regulator [Amycolatopsis]MBB2506429.1 TetR/AcrR family transcriptional regulator [Amycolatopsis echigonensis]PKV90876.1 TetR family transcriptional regulator [Amycolatopsis niigatensis]